MNLCRKLKKAIVLATIAVSWRCKKKCGAAITPARAAVSRQPVHLRPSTVSRSWSNLKKHRSHAPVRPDPKPIFSYSKALRFLSTLSDFERLRIVRYNTQNFDLDRMRTLLKKLGNPQDQFRSVHVAGTKGKGSTCAMIASMLQACGYKVGLYTSPHLVDIRERIVINGDMISQADFARLVRLIEPIVARIKPTPTYFDVLTAIAFKYFAEQKVDIAVVETGLGGRLDSTNVIQARSDRHHQHQQRSHGPAWARPWPHRRRKRPASSSPASPPSASCRIPRPKRR